MKVLQGWPTAILKRKDFNRTLWSSQMHTYLSKTLKIAIKTASWPKRNLRTMSLKSILWPARCSITMQLVSQAERKRTRPSSCACSVSILKSSLWWAILRNLSSYLQISRKFCSTNRRTQSSIKSMRLTKQDRPQISRVLPWRNRAQFYLLNASRSVIAETIMLSPTI